MGSGYAKVKYKNCWKTFISTFWKVLGAMYWDSKGSFKLERTMLPVEKLKTDQSKA